MLEIEDLLVILHLLEHKPTVYFLALEDVVTEENLKCLLFLQALDLVVFGSR